MARVDFAFGAPHRLRKACEVVHRHYLAGRRLLIYTADARRLAHFDQLLWSFEPTAFIPHVADDDPLAEVTPVLLSQHLTLPLTQDSDGQPPWLLNLDLALPPQPERFKRILEIVSLHDEDRKAARERWRQYQTLGHEMHAHDLGQPDQ